MVKKMERQTFPSIRANMGDWTYFVTTMTFGDVAKWIKRPKQTKEKDEDFKNWLQREIDNSRLGKISKYLLEQPQHFFNAIVVGIFGGDPKWYPVSVSKSPTLGDVEIGERAETSMGVLELSGEEDAFPIDGQHRVEAIKEAVKANTEIKNDEQCIIFVAHKTDKEGHERTRRLFTTLNKYARPVSKGEIVALDEDDAFAIVTRRLMESYRPLSPGFVSFTKTPNLVANDKKGVTTTVALYLLVETLALPKGSKERTPLKVGPPNEKRIQNIFKDACSFWDALRKYVPSIKKVTDSNPEEGLAGRYRKGNGGHILFRPAGQQAFANAARIMMDRGKNMDDAVKALSKTKLQLSSPPWRGVLWDSSTETMITKYKVLAQNLFLYMAGEDPMPKYYDLIAEYRRVLDDQTASLKELGKQQQG